MSEVIGGVLIFVGLFSTAGLIQLGKNAIRKAIRSFKEEVFSDLAEIKTNVVQVNNAVNHVEPGIPPLTRRVDRIEETQTKAKEQLEEFIGTTNEFIDTTNNKLDLTNASIEKLLVSHVETRQKFDEAIKAIPKRKQDYTEEN